MIRLKLKLVSQLQLATMFAIRKMSLAYKSLVVSHGVFAQRL
jgi:hypothetical protein